MKIYNNKHYNMNCIVMENKNIKLKVIPKIGFKIASLTYKDNEFLFQPTNLKYTIPNYKDNFSDYDTSGLDEMIPTIDSYMDENGFLIPDHGDVWSIPWDVEVINNSIIGRVSLRSVPLEFYKKISFYSDNIIKMDYKVKNNSKNEHSYLWALHGLNNYDDDTEIIFPKGVNRLLDVINNEIIDKNVKSLLKLNKYKDNMSYKYYVLDELNTGNCGLHYKKLGLKYMIRFDKDINPYLGIWITKGGFKGEYNCALEPSNGFYDSLKLAKDNNKYQKIMPMEEKSWTVNIEISEL